MDDKDSFFEWFKEYFITSVKDHLSSLGLNQKALLIIDSATVHLCNFELCDENIKVIFLPPNTTALIQPLDQGVISCFKRVYKRNF